MREPAPRHRDPQRGAGKTPCWLWGRARTDNHGGEVNPSPGKLAAREFAGRGIRGISFVLGISFPVRPVRRDRAGTSGDPIRHQNPPQRPSSYAQGFSSRIRGTGSRLPIEQGSSRSPTARPFPQASGRSLPLGRQASSPQVSTGRSPHSLGRPVGCSLEFSTTLLRHSTGSPQGFPQRAGEFSTGFSTALLLRALLIERSGPNSPCRAHHRCAVLKGIR